MLQTMKTAVTASILLVALAAVHAVELATMDGRNEGRNCDFYGHDIEQ